MTEQRLRELIAGGESLAAAELCRIGPFQATRILNRLVRQKRLIRHGQRKGAWYERASNM